MGGVPSCGFKREGTQQPADSPILGDVRTRFSPQGHRLKGPVNRHRRCCLEGTVLPHRPTVSVPRLPRGSPPGWLWVAQCDAQAYSHGQRFLFER